MHSSNNDTKDDTDIENNSQIRHTNSPSTIPNSSQPSSPSCSTLLVIDDTSNSEDETITHTNNIPVKPMLTFTAQLSHIQLPTTLSPSTHDILNDTVDQQRRRNSSIAKLLGGGRLHNQQYEEIHQQILHSQSAHILTNNDNSTDSGIQRTRSSITRSLLMNAERTNSMTKLPPKPPVPTASSYSKDFEYLIRREVDRVDNEHGPLTLQRNNSVPKVVQNLNSSSNTNAQSKLKRKRPVPKPPLTTPNAPPFALHDPFEIESPVNNSIPSVKHSQNQFFHFDPSKRSRYPNHQPYPMPTNNSSSYLYPTNQMNSSGYNQFNIQHDQTPSNTCSSSCNCHHYSPASATNSIPSTSSRKAKSMLVRPNSHERPRRRSYSNTSNQSDSVLEVSSKTTGPLKKRLLDAYNNEHNPALPL